MDPHLPHRIEELARKWLDGTISADEQLEFSNWYNRDQDRPAIIPPSVAESEDEHREKLKSAVLRSVRLRRQFIFWKTTAAACAVLAAAFTIYNFLSHNSPEPAPEPTVGSFTDILPGSEKAILTLDDGHSLLLDEQRNAVLKDSEGLKIRQVGGMVVYEPLENGDHSHSYNVIATPRGGQYSLQLPDGSKVWLNAASSLRFPTRFTGSQRTVELNGEAFFEIVPDSQRGEFTPFYVETKGKQTVKVLGTKFNINSYADELSIKTTLVEGSVEILDPQGETTRLKPRQQAMLSDNGKLRVIDGVDLEEALAWRNGMWLFRETEIREILRQVARWYDVDVVYEKDIPERRFNGGISRDSRLSSILAILETSGIHFSVEGKTIKVTR